MRRSSISRISIILVVLMLLGAFQLFAAGQEESQESAGQAESQATEEEEWPTGPITIVVGANPGGSSDTSARALANAASQYLNNVPITIVNRPGAVGIVGAQYALTQPDDGTTLYHNWGNVHFTFARHVREFPFNPMEEFRAVSGVVSLSVALVVPIDSPFDTVEELVEYAKENPNELTYTTAGRGGAHWLVAIDFIRKADIELRPIANEQGGAEARNMVAGGVVDVSFMATFLGAAMEGERVKTLAVAFPERDPLMPNVRTFEEIGYPVVMAAPTQLLATHASVPDWKVERLSDALQSAMEDQAFLEAVSARGLVPIPWDYQEAQAHADRMDKEFAELAVELDLAE